MSAPSAPPSDRPAPPVSASLRGRWKIGTGILSVACLAQAALWTMWWDDPTHFKMSVLFVWPAGLFALLIWWTFFSGWSSRVRFRSVAAGAILIAAFFALFRLDRFNGDMVPTRLDYRWSPDANARSREYIRTLKPADNDEQQSQEASPLVAIPSDWPGFRGSGRDGIVHDITLRTDWTDKPPREVWRHPVGKAWSSFAVVDSYVFTQEQRDDNEAVVAYRFQDGAQLWQHSDKASLSAAEPQGGTGPRATPQFSDGKIFALGATGLLNCLDARTGKRIWSTDILKDAGTKGQPAPNMPWGMSGSPLVVNEYVIVNPGGVEGNTVAAYDKQTGRRIWSSGDQPAGYASPILTTLYDEPVLLVPAGTGLAAYSPANGTALWFFPWQNESSVNSAMPVVLPDNTILFGTGYGVGTVRLDVKFDQQRWSVSQRWHSNRFRPKFNDFVVFEGCIYGLDDGRLSCLDLQSGNLKWKGQHYGYGQILLVDKLLLIVSEDGNVVLIPATPTRPEELARFAALSEGVCWNHPVLVRGKLLVRSSNEAACFELSTDEPEAANADQPEAGG